MKKYIITFKINGDKGEGVSSRDIPNELGKEIQCEYRDMQVSDGYHTMDELYDHRIALYIALCREIGCRWGQPNPVWRSKLHSDGTSFEGWFILGIYIEKGNQITYHLPLKNWDDTAFANTRDKAPEFDGHTSADVIERIKNI